MKHNKKIIIYTCKSIPNLNDHQKYLLKEIISYDFESISELKGSDSVKMTLQLILQPELGKYDIEFLERHNIIEEVNNFRSILSNKNAHLSFEEGGLLNLAVHNNGSTPNINYQAVGDYTVSQVKNRLNILNDSACCRLIDSKFTTVDKLTELGLQNSYHIEMLVNYNEIYISYVDRGLTTPDKLLALLQDKEPKLRRTFVAFEALGEFPEAVDKLLKLGITFDELYKFGLRDGDFLYILLRGVKSFTYLLKNKYISSLKDLSDTRMQSKQNILFHLDSIVLLLQNDYPLTFSEIVTICGNLECNSFFKYSEVYKSYVEKGLVTFDELFLLKRTHPACPVFEALGMYPESVDKLLKLGVNFRDLYTLGLQDSDRFIVLLLDINSSFSQKWLKERSPMIKEIDETQKKLDILKLNAADFNLFMQNYGCKITIFLQLPLTVLQNFAESNCDEEILINAMPAGTKALLTQVEKQQVQSDNISLN